MSATTPRSLVWATDIDVLPVHRTVQPRDGFLAVRSPSNPTHYWGNFLLFPEPPRPGDRARWEELFAHEFADQPACEHRAFCWDRTDGDLGAADEEFAPHGYHLEQTVGLIAPAQEIHAHPRANADVRVTALDPRLGADDEPLWDQVVEIQVAGRDKERFDEDTHRRFCRVRQDDMRELFTAGKGAWYVALAGDEVVGSCGIVVSDGRGRFQTVDTAEGHRRKGICRRLVTDAAKHAAATYGARRLVIAADPDYHALGIYESVGFRPVELVAGVCLQPPRGRGEPAA